MSGPRRGGQTLVLFALGLLLLALMVLVTISIGTRVTERVELQTTADAAAYSNAVATARAFNSISLLNRTQVSHMAVAAGLQSMIDFSTAYAAHVSAAQKMWLSFGGCTFIPNTCTVICPPGKNGCQREVLSAIRAGSQAIANERCRLKGLPPFDAAAATEVLGAVTQALTLYTHEREVYGKLQTGVLDQQRLAARLAAATGAAEVTAPGAASLISLRELQGLKGCVGEGAACEEPYTVSHAVFAGMGTRGSGFITDREGARELMNAQLARLPTGPADGEIVVGQFLGGSAKVDEAEGSTYFDSDVASHGARADGHALSADDHGEQSAVFKYEVPDPKMKGFCCLPTAPGGGSGYPCDSNSEPDEVYRKFLRNTSSRTSSALRSTDAIDGSDLHDWGASADPAAIARALHSTLACTADCPTVWPTFIDYNFDLVANQDDVFGQPKNHALLQRDYAARPPDPWNPFFRFQFTAASSALFDNRGLRANGRDISKQHALATGLTYYHRMNHWKEPPNFLNPFWRATLVPWDIDAQGRGTDVPQLLRASGASDAALSLELLRAAGFKGAH